MRAFNGIATRLLQRFAQSRNAPIGVLVSLLTFAVPVQAEEIYYYHNDHLGTPQFMTDANQNLVWKSGQDPFGANEPVVASIDNNLRFPGQYYDDETGLHYNWHRYYKPKKGRYISSDPIGLRGGVNTYVYAQANPLLFFDINGLDTAGCDIGPFKVFETPCRLECCAVHDECYYNYNCSALSWFDETSPCGQCNVEAIKCFLACQEDPDKDNPSRPNYYCAKEGKYIDVPSCGYPDIETAEKECRN